MFRADRAREFWWLVLIISWVTSAACYADQQLQIGDKISIFSDKAYRKNQGKYFEAVGNVIIISGKDTIYGELASLDQEQMTARIEGNVRVITKDMTLYGSHVEYNIATGFAAIKNARIMNMDFNLVANELIRINEKEYLANEAEFTTCKDCTESWSIYGKQIRVRVGDSAIIRHGLAKIKGVDVLYLPYIVLPIQSKRRSGLIFPKISLTSRNGTSVEQPIFLAFDESKDLTLTPAIWSLRGYGGDVQYRQRFAERRWFQLDSRILNDQVFKPGKTTLEKTGDEFFRYFSELETHQQLTPNWNAHARLTGTRDLDIVRNFPDFTDTRNITSEFGFQGFSDYRRDHLTVGLEANYLRNQLFDDPMGFDRSYVQMMPRLNLSATPYSVIQSNVFGFHHLAVGLDSSLTRFRQVDVEQGGDLRNADRLSAQPYLLWHLFTAGPVSMKTRYIMDQQSYQFAEKDQASFGKNAGLMRTEVSFTMDKIFGLAYEEKIPIRYVPEKDLERLREKKEQGLSPLQKTERRNRLVGEIPTFESELAQDTIVQVKNSYRHSQEFKFVHHFIASENHYGNRNFWGQIQSNSGWFDYEDARRSQEWRFGSAATRTQISPQNTMEFVWNNSLIRKTPKSFNYLLDDKYLRDNFTYSKIGYFNVSQGYLLRNEGYDDYRQRLSRLAIETGYNTNRWSVALNEYYFHYENDNIFTLNGTRRFEYLHLLGSYNYNSVGTELKTLSAGGQVRPTDTLGFALIKEVDLQANTNIRTVYALDIMPNNNCWILNLNYRESLVNSQYSFNILWNFGDERFDRYRTNWFAVPRR